MGAIEDLSTAKTNVNAAIADGKKSLAEAAKDEAAFIQKCAGIGDEFASKYMKDRALTLEIKPSDAPDVKALKRAMNSAEQNRLANVEKTSKVIEGVTAAVGAAATVVSPPVGAAIMLVGTIVDMTYKLYNSKPGQDWSKIAMQRWSVYKDIGLPRPMFADQDKIQPYVKQKLERGVGWNVLGFGTSPDEYEALYNSMNANDFANQNIAYHGGYLHTAPPNVFRALYLQNMGLLMTSPPATINEQNTQYQASPYMAYQYEAFGHLEVTGAGSGSNVPVWYWYLDCNLWFCNEQPVPVNVRSADGMKAVGVDMIPPHKKGVSFRRLYDGQVLIDTLINQVCLTAAISQGLPTWASAEVLDAGKRAWSEYRKKVLLAYYEVEARGGDGVTDPKIGEITGVTHECNLNPERPGDVRQVNRGPNGFDAIGYVYEAAINKATEVVSRGLTLANTPTMRPAWIEYAKKADFQYVGTAQRHDDMLQLSESAKRKLALRKRALVVPGDNPAYLISEVPQYVKNTFLLKKKDDGLSPYATVAMGLGGLVVIGGVVYWISRRN